MRLGDPQQVGQLMRERRKKLGFTIEQMAEAVGLSPITIMRIELGRVGYIHNKTAKALEVPKKIVRRMVAVDVPVGENGESLPVTALPLPSTPKPAEPRNPEPSGDVMLVGADVRPILARRKQYKPRKAKETLAAPIPKASGMKRALLWLAAKV